MDVASRPMPEAAGDARNAKIKNLLASYYADDAGGFNDAPVGALSAPPPNPDDMDSTAFHAEHYLQRALQETPMPELKERCNNLTNEILQLDGDMQLLVYENYSKFISATDTVKAMKDNVDSMDTRMQQLQQLIETVSSRNNAVDAKLHERRQHIEDLNQVRNVLAKLQAVFDLPIRMKAALQMGAVEVAVQQYTEVRPVLYTFQHKAAFRKVASEAETYKREAATTLKQRITDCPEQAADSLQLMQRLGEPLEHLQDEYVDSIAVRLDNLLQVAGQVLKARAVAKGLLAAPVEPLHLPKDIADELQSPDGDANLPKFLVGLNTLFLSELARAAASFAQVFDKGPQRNKLVKMARSTFARYLKIVRRAFADVATLKAAEAAGITTKSALQNPPAESQSVSPVGTDWGSRMILEALHIVSIDLPRLQGPLPEVSPKDRATEVIENVVRYHITACFSALEERVMATLAWATNKAQQVGSRHDAASGLMQDLLLCRSVCQGVLKAGVDTLMAETKVYEGARWLMNTWQGAFPHVIAGQLRQLLALLHTRIKALSAVCFADMTAQQLQEANAAVTNRRKSSLDGGVGELAKDRSGGHPDAAMVFGDASVTPTPAEPAPSCLLLLLSSVLRYMSQQLLPHLDNVVAAGVLGSPTHLKGEFGAANALDAIVPPELARALHSGALELLQSYIELQNQRLAGPLQRGMDAAQWAQAKEPRAPRPVCDLVADRLAAVQNELSVLLYTHGVVQPQQSPSRPTHAKQHRGSSHGAPSTSSHRDVSSQQSLQFTKQSVMQALVARAAQALKAGVEQQHIFNRQGLQQMQLDCYYMTKQLSRLESSPNWACFVQDAFGSVVDAAATRCSGDAIYLEEHVMNAIVARVQTGGQTG